MRPVVNAIPEPFILLDAQRRVIVANRAAEDLFGIGLTGFNLVRAIRSPEVIACVDRVLAGAPTSDATLTITLPVRATYRALAVLIEEDETQSDIPARVAAALSLRDISHIIEAEQMRSNFVANVSHELRSPLTVLTGFIETLQTTARDDPASREKFLAIMEREAERMDRLIDDLLSLSRVEANAHLRPDVPIDLMRLIAELVETLRSQGQAGRIVLNLVDGIASACVPGDRDELIQVFRNLLDNALKYSPDGTPVTIAIREQAQAPGIRGPALVVEVRDEGEGIPVEHIPRLTERFYRVDAGRSREQGGTGLGLAIVKHIVSRHRGRLQIRSEMGVGSSFTVILPAT